MNEERVLGRYRLLSRLAVGGMGEVFLARQESAMGFERTVVLKRLLPGTETSAHIRARFIDEARVAALLNHPNVISTLEAGEWGGSAWLAMEYVPGWTLSQLMRELQQLNLTLPARLAARIVADACLGLQHAHDARNASGPLGIVHRDISPQNLMVRSDGVTKVVDFGVAFSAADRQARTQTGAVVGKLAYMAPEQVQGSRAEPRSDQYSLGVVFWELLTHRRCFTASTELDLARRVLTETVPHPCDVDPSIPRLVGDVAMRMMSRSPEHRFPNCAAVAEQLSALGEPQSGSLADFLAPMLPVPAERAGSTADAHVMKALLPGTGSASGAATVVSAGATVPSPAVRGAAPAAAPSAPARRLWPQLGALALAGGLATMLWAALRTENPTALEPTVGAVDPAAPSAASSPPDASSASAPVAAPMVNHPDAPGTAADGGPEAAASASAGKPLGPETAPTGIRTSSAKKVRKPAEPIAPAAPTETGRVTIDSEPWSRVSIDGQSYGITPVANASLSAGKHTVVLVTEGGTYERTIVVKPGEPLRAKFKLP